MEVTEILIDGGFHLKNRSCYSIMLWSIGSPCPLALENCYSSSFAKTWMNLMDVMLHEIKQAEKDKYCMNSLICEIKVQLIEMG